MQAITIEAGELRFRDDHELPHVAGDEVRVRVLEAGICETDIQLARGYMNFSGVLGHEFVGIAQSGPLADRRVVGEINCNCRNCPRCRSGLGNHCAHRTVIGIDRHDGAFAQWVAVPQHNLHAIPDSVSDDEAVFVEPLAAAFEFVQRVPLRRDASLIVLGDGRLGYLCAQTAATRVTRVDVVGKHPAKLDRFAKRGFRTIRLEEIHADHSYDFVIDCTGSASGLPLALTLVRPRGTVIMKTTVAAEHHASLAGIVIDEIQVIGSRCGPFDVAIDALRDRTVDVTSLITHRFQLPDAALAFETAVSPQAFKVVFEMKGIDSDGK